MLDENQNIISVTQGNIYFIFGQRLVTPKLDRCGVIGSRRSLILDLAESLEMNVEEVNISINDAIKADEVFISNSIIGIQSVSSIENCQFPKSAITEQINKAFESVTQDIKSWTCI
jgi:4-amino-4-deoxychorismate lyase